MHYSPPKKKSLNQIGITTFVLFTCCNSTVFGHRRAINERHGKYLIFRVFLCCLYYCSSFILLTMPCSEALMKLTILSISSLCGICCPIRMRASSREKLPIYIRRINSMVCSRISAKNNIGRDIFSCAAAILY